MAKKNNIRGRAPREWKLAWQTWMRHPDKKELEPIIQASLNRFRDITSWQDLIFDWEKHDNDWVIAIARKLHPKKMHLWAPGIVKDAAYYLRYLELIKSITAENKNFKPVPIALNPVLIDAIEKRRGKLSRSRYVRNILYNALKIKTPAMER